MIEVKHLVKRYGNHVAVDDLSLTVEKGKIYGFLGPNGAGKSTTMNMITGYLGATSGEVKINGFDIFTQPEEARRCIGYLPEIPPLYVDMTVMEYLSFVAELKKIKKDERKNLILEAMELTKITDMKDRLIKNLSKGYKQRVGLAQAMLGFPEVIILDEPTVGLDPKQIIEIRDLIKQLGEKHTVILSSHILSEVSAVCDHIFIISKGKLVASESTENLSSLMDEKQELTLEVKGKQAVVERLLDEELHLDAYEIKEEKEGLLKITLDINAKAGEQDIRESLFYILAEHRQPIYRMNYKGKSLEDVFLELTESAGESMEPSAEKVGKEAHGEVNEEAKEENKEAKEVNKEAKEVNKVNEEAKEVDEEMNGKGGVEE